MLGGLLSTQVKAQQNPQNFCYVEVNDNNLLNVGAYTLTNSGKPAFDSAIIFAGNINYDASKGRTYIYNNNNVTKVLNDVNTYVRPLQQKGIKVLLSLIGNHQGVGILNFQNQAAAKDFALQVANTVYTYGLDGVDFDDEYAGYPTTGNVKNGASFTMLLQELKAAMPDKLVTLYDYSDSVGAPVPTTYLTNGADRAGNYIDYAYNGLYGTYMTQMATAVPPLGKPKLGAAAFNVQSTSTSVINTQSTRTKTDGYGVIVWYDLRQADASAKISTSTSNLYGETTTLSGATYAWTAGVNCDAPVGLDAVNLAGTSGTLTWTGDATKTYNIDYKAANSSTWTSVATNYSGSSIAINNLTANTEYDWRIQSNCSASLTSTYIFAPRFNSGNGCIAPYGLSSSNYKGTSATVSWTSTNASSYTIQYKAATAADWTTVNNVTTNTYNLQGLTPNTAYTWKVQSSCGAQVSTFSNESSFKSGFTPVQSPGNRSLYFNGTTNYLDAGNFDLSGNALTLEGWVKMSAFQTAFPYISSVAGIEGGDNNSALLRFGDGDIPTGDYLQFVVSIGGAQVKLKSATKFNKDAWYHIAATYDGAAMKLYVNGALDATVSASGAFNANGNFFLAARNSNNNDRRLNGFMDEFRVWKKALSVDEVVATQCIVAPNAAGLEANWKFNEGSGIAAFDQTANTHFAILNNMTDANWSTDVACVNDMAVSDVASAKTKIYPNPVKKGDDIHFVTKEKSAIVTLYDATGKLVKTQKISDTNSVISSSNLGAGLYIYKVQSADASAVVDSGKVMVK